MCGTRKYCSPGRVSRDSQIQLYVFEQLFTPVYHPNLFLLYTNDILLNEEAKIAAFADDNAILSMKLQKLLIA